MPPPLDQENPHQSSCSWLPYEDEQLRIAIAQVDFRDWTSVAQYFGGFRSATDYKSRWSTLVSTRPHRDSTRRQWKPFEDARLHQLVGVYGVGQWQAIAARMSCRSNKQCRERWRNHLDPGIRHEPWTNEEDALILQLQAQQGNRWSEIAQQLPGRTAHAVRSRWHFHLKMLTPSGPQRLPTDEPTHGESHVTGGIHDHVLADAALADSIIQSLEDSDG